MSGPACVLNNHCLSSHVNYSFVMKKLISIIAVAAIALTASFSAKAIEDPDAVGTIKAGARVGLYPGIGSNVSVDYVLVDSWWKGHFTIGAFTGFKLYFISGDNYSYRDNYFSIMPRATYGLNITDKFEVHAGAMSGVYFFKQKSKIEGSYTIKGKDRSTGFDYGTFVGCDYFFSGAIGVTAELGYFSSMPYTNVGLVLKF